MTNNQLLYGEHSANNRLTFVILLTLLTLTGHVVESSQASCPSDCHCLPDATNSDQLKVSCRWSHIPDVPLPFVTFPQSATRSLTIECTATASTYQPQMFAVFGAQLRHLELRGCTADVTQLPAKLFDGLPLLQTLEIDGFEGRMTLHEEAFDALASLESLTITNSGLDRLPRRTLCQLPNLKMLNLSGNAIATLAAIGQPFVGERTMSMSCGEQLVLMDVSDNQISTIPTNSWSQLRTLRALRLARNKITKIEPNAFTSSSNIAELWLNENAIEEINDLPAHTRQLDVSHNRMGVVPPVVSALTELYALNISHNRIDGTGEPVFASKKLQELDLSYNSFHWLPNTLFLGKPSLQRLYVSNNRLEELSPSVFVNLTSLTHLDLSHNQLTAIGGLQTKGLTSLVDLNVDNNLLLEIDGSLFDETPRLRRLHLRHNQLTKLPDGLDAASNLRQLLCGNNRIGSIQKFLFNKLPLLRVLELSNNMLEQIERHVFEDLQSLEKLDLSGNGIVSIQASAFDRCPSLTALRLQHNQLSAIDNVLHNLVALRKLTLDHNRLDVLDIAQVPDNVQLLTATHNRLKIITNTEPSRDCALAHVDLSDNQLAVLNANTWPTTLVTLNISNNHIELIEDDTFANCQRLQLVDLSHNKLKSLSESAVLSTSSHGNSQSASVVNARARWLDTPMQLHLADNPFECNCHVEWLQTVDAAKLIIADVDNVVCEHVTSGQHYTLKSINRAELLCPYKQLCTQTCGCCQFEDCDCRNVCPDGCQCYNDNLMVTNIVQCTGLAESANLDLRKMPMYATVLYLDGMRLPRIGKHTFFGRFTLRRLYMNNSEIGHIEPLAFKGLSKLALLDLSHNQLTEWRGDEVQNTDQIRALRLNDNRLATLSSTALGKLPALQSLALHNNQFEQLPTAVNVVTPHLTDLTLSGNPWRCDCHDRFVIQQWMQRVENRHKVSDESTMLCVENLSAHVNDSGALSMLPANDDDTVKVNFWTFHRELNRSLCDPVRQGVSDQRHLVVDDMPSVDVFMSDHLSRIGWITVAVLGASALVVVVVLVVVLVFRTNNHSSSPHNRSQTGAAGWFRCKQSKSPASLNSSATTTTTPILGHDIFITYSQADQREVEEMAARLEHESPYYQVCLLHQHTRLNQFHFVADEPLRLMERSQCNIIYLSPAFLNNEWKLMQIRTMLGLLRESKKYMVIVTSPDLNVETTTFDDPLDKCLRTNTRIKRDDPRFWQLLTEALPLRTDDSSSSSCGQYSYVYGTIKPSMLV